MMVILSYEIDDSAYGMIVHKEVKLVLTVGSLEDIERHCDRKLSELRKQLDTGAYPKRGDKSLTVSNNVD